VKDPNNDNLEEVRRKRALIVPQLLWNAVFLLHCEVALVIPGKLPLAIWQVDMAAPNFTEDGHQKTFEDLTCSPDLTIELHGQLKFLSVLNSFMSATAFLGNALVLIALRKESSLHPPSKLLLRTLATTDLCVGLIAEPLIVTFWISVVKENWGICRYALVTGIITSYILCGVSVATLTAISVDRLLALLLGLRYRQVVTLKRTYVVVITLWFLPAVFSAMYFWNLLITFWYGIIYLSLCLIISIFSYSKIFFTFRHHQNQVQDHFQQPNQTNQLHMGRYKKAVSTAIWLQLTLVACYLPYGLVEALRIKIGLSSSVYRAWSCTVTLVYLNSSLNPILYCWKLNEVRQAVKDTIRPQVGNCFTS